jgi:hypothetical protein
MHGWTSSKALAFRSFGRAGALVATVLAAASAQGEPLRPQPTRAEQIAADRVQAALQARDCSRAARSGTARRAWRPGIGAVCSS